MKKTIIALMAVSAMMFSACNSDEPVSAVTDGNVTFVAQLPGEFTRALGTGTQATKLSYAVYEAGTTTPVISSLEAGAPQAEFTGLQTTLSLNLVKGKTYDVVFWADNEAAPYTFDPATQSVKIDYTAINGNQENRDAFFQVERDLAVNGAIQKTVTLRRPFAQINFGTDDMAAAEAAKTVVASTKLKVDNVYSTLNLLTGVASDPVEVTFDYNGLLKDEVFPVDAKYTYLSMNYLLTGSEVTDNVQAAEKELVNCEFTMKDDAGKEINTLTISNVPVQRNYRTNIYGSLLTSKIDYTINIDPEWNNPDLEPEANVSTAEDFISALANPFSTKLIVTSDVDLSDASIEDLTFGMHKELNIAEGATVKLGNKNHLTALHGMTLSGGGTLSNTSDDNSDLGAGWYKSLIHVMDGDLVVEGVTLENDPGFHYHGNAGQGRPYNSAAIAYWNNANVTVTDARIVSGEFTICGMGRTTASGTVTLTNSYFESTSSSQNGTNNWSYAMRLFGNKAVLNNCEVKGIQGAVSTDGCVTAEINGGKYYTVNSPGKKDSFYALYVTNGTQVTINGGEFWAAEDRSGGLAEGTSAVVCGDNDTGLEAGSVVIKSGKFSGKPYNTTTRKTYEPANGWTPIEGDDTFKWEAK